jgi:hypothetical protein
MSSRAMSLKSKINNYAKQNKIAAQKEIFCEALVATAAHRGSTKRMGDANAICSALLASEELRNTWAKYQKTFFYAEEISYDDTINALRGMLN